ncbi:hypothetical protein [Catellatospora tritici]|uniref:hypothetical protein n=1 Tax=Catellatospora tritici TaxID=2851566 RepID=UPI001C2DA333|nr:hypothetical protein [Catellatospora tritici]MBV1856540.1 hypothetical protein [Catellatospora tritici]
MAADRTGERILAELHAGLRERRAPQQVARDLLDLEAYGWLSPTGARELHGVARAARGRGAVVGSSMPITWRRHPGLTRAYEAAVAAVRVVAEPAEVAMPDAADAADPGSLRRWLGAALDLLGLPSAEPRAARRTVPVGTITHEFGPWKYTRRRTPQGRRGDTGGHADKRQRFDAATRRSRLPGVPVRAYRRAVRAVLHLQQRTAVLAAERDREAAIAFGKTRLAHLITVDDFTACPRTAAFVAYYVARLGMRTRFTNGSQTRPMDSLAEELLKAALAAPTCRPEVLAMVSTRAAVLDRLDDQQCGELLGVYYEQLAACARTLRAAYDLNRDPMHMVMRRGDDSSSWNAASRAFNQARTGWLNLTMALGYDDVVEAACPGKVPALVASDVAYWHTISGGEQHIDVRVWAELPLPWDVVLGDDDCSADLVRQTCRENGVDPERDGWTKPYQQDYLERPAPAPDLVHGVEIASPLLAGLLRDIGVFSGHAPTGRQLALAATLSREAGQRG